MRCLVTGATGFIGAHLVRELRRQDCQVAIIRRPRGNPWRIAALLDTLEELPGDLAQIQRIAARIRRFRPEVVFHLGWAGVAKSGRQDAVQIRQNLVGSLDLFQVAADSGCRVWIGLGSQAEYGTTDDILDEDRCPRPDTLYGAAKVATGLCTAQLGQLQGVRTVWLRLLAAYGPMDNEDHLIPYVIRTLLSGQTPVLTWGEQRWDYLFIDDVVRALWACALEPEARGIYTLASGAPLTVRWIAESLRARLRPETEIIFTPAPPDPRFRRQLAGNSARLRAATGWEPRVAPDVGLARTAQWALEAAGRDPEIR